MLHFHTNQDVIGKDSCMKLFACWRPKTRLVVVWGLIGQLWRRFSHYTWDGGEVDHDAIALGNMLPLGGFVWEKKIDGLKRRTIDGIVTTNSKW